MTAGTWGGCGRCQAYLVKGSLFPIWKRTFGTLPGLSWMIPSRPCLPAYRRKKSGLRLKRRDLDRQLRDAG